MTLSKRWVNWAAKLHAATAQSAGAVHIDGIRSVSLTPNLASRLEGGDGSPYNTYQSLVAGAPVASLSTTDLPALLDQIGVAGMLVDRDATHPGVVLYAQRMALGGTRAALDASNHVSYTLGNGILVPRTLELSHQEPAMLMAELVAVRDYANSIEPLVYDEAADLTAATYPADSVIFTLGKISLNGTDVEGLMRVSIDFGIQLLVEGSDSDIYPSFVSIAKIQPQITFESKHLDLSSVLTEDGAYYTASQVVVYARKRAEGGTFVADGTAEHVAFTLGKSRVEIESVSPDDSMIRGRIVPYYTAGGSPVTPLTVDTTSAIS